MKCVIGNECPESGQDMVNCIICMQYYHVYCDNIKLTDHFEAAYALSSLKKHASETSYICYECTENNTDFDSLMRQLNNIISSYNQDKVSCLLPVLHYRNVINPLVIPYNRCPRYVSSSLIDKHQLQIMQARKDHMIYRLRKNPVPLKSTGDGSCLFHSVSLALFGNESKSDYLRYRSILNLYTNFDVFAKYLNAAGFSNYLADKETHLEKNVFLTWERGYIVMK